MPQQQYIDGIDYYIDAGRWVFTAIHHLKRGRCCGSGCRHCPYTDPNRAMNEAEMTCVIQEFLAAINRHDLDGQLLRLAPALIFHDKAEGRVGLPHDGKQRYAEYAQRQDQRFQGRTVLVEAARYHRNAAEVAVSIVGTLQVDVPTIGTTGTQVRLRGNWEFHFRRGLICGLSLS